MFENFKLKRDIKRIVSNPKSSSDDLRKFYAQHLRVIFKYNTKLSHKINMREVLTKFVNHPNMKNSLISYMLTHVPVVADGKSWKHSHFSDFIDAVIANRATSEKILFEILEQNLTTHHVNNILHHPNSNEALLKICYYSGSFSQRIMAEKFMVERDDMQDWPEDWLEQHYGRKLTWSKTQNWETTS